MNERLSYPTPQNSSPEAQPRLENRHLSDGLDFYKLTMGQLALEQHPETAVTFTMKNRSGEYALSEYVDIAALQARFEAIRNQGFSSEEIAYFAGLETQTGCARFDAPYLDFLADLKLTDVKVWANPKTGDLSVESTGPWANVSLWETVVMSEINELYYQTFLQKNNLTVDDVWAEGDRRLNEKIERLKNSNVKFADFGTRRRFSAAWQNHVIGRLAGELPNNFVGTSNPWFAYKHNLNPIGTYAHEMPMVYTALADRAGRNPLTGNQQMMKAWYQRYGEDLSIALTDTFTSDFFFSDFSTEQAKAWRGLRHDSGDPIDFGEQAIAFYKANGIDPHQKTIVFSDGLDIDTIFKLNEYFDGRINVLFGWGTSLMNDMGIRANNFVMKATEASGVSTVKLSDVLGKQTGPKEQVERYQNLAEIRQQVDDVYKTLANA